MPRSVAFWHVMARHARHLWISVVLRPQGRSKSTGGLRTCHDIDSPIETRTTGGLMNKWEYRRRVRHNKMSDDIDKRNRHRCAAAMAVCVLANIAFTICCAQPTASAYAQSADDVAHEVAQAACRTSMLWPLEHAQVIGEYDALAKQWLPGHRGLDLRARPQDAIIAPADGVVAFSGKVAGKSVVTLRHGAETGSLTSTFEPAVTTRPVGAVIVKGERFARVEGGSEHCADECLHWGLKSGGRDYADPSGRVRPMRVELKPL